MKHTYVILSDSRDDIAETKAVAAVFPQLAFVGSETNYENGLDLILEKNPDIVFLEIQPAAHSSGLGFSLINELYRYLDRVPQIIVTAKNSDLAYEAIKYDVHDYLVTPFRSLELRKSIMRLAKKSGSVSAQVPKAQESQSEISGEQPVEAVEAVIDEPQGKGPEIIAVEIAHPVVEPPKQEVVLPESNKSKPLIVCVKSYGDYRFIDADQISYLQADNNSTDIHLSNGEMITAFKTLKHFENELPLPFVRIHNSYIVNSDYVSRIHTGNSVCYIKNSTTKLPFSKSYKENIEAIISSISNGNYLEF